MKLITSLLIAIFLLSACNDSKQHVEQTTKEEDFHGLNLSQTKEEVLKKHSQGFKKCSEYSGGESYCTWNKGDQPFEVITFFNNRIGIVSMPINQLTLKEYIKSLEGNGTKVSLEPIKAGSPVTEADFELVKQGALNVLDFDKVKLGDYLAFGCTAVVPYFKGNLKYMGIKKDYFVKDCTTEATEILTSNTVMYYSNEFTKQ